MGNKYASDHSHFYGFREINKANGCHFCTKDGNTFNFETDTPYRTLTPSKSDGSHRGCSTENLDYRPKICEFTSKRCESDWKSVIIGEFSDACNDPSRKLYGV